MRFYFLFDSSNEIHVRLSTYHIIPLRIFTQQVLSTKYEISCLIQTKKENPDITKPLAMSNTRTMCEVSSKLTTKAPERRHWLGKATYYVLVKMINKFTKICYRYCQMHA